MPAPKYSLPSLDSDSGAMQAVLLAEVPAPGGSKLYTEDRAKTAMSAMVATVQNRLASSSYFNPIAIYGVKNPTTKRNIIGASSPTQFEGFANLVLGNAQKTNIQAKLDVANKETPEQATLENSYSRYADFAIGYSNAANVRDPLKDFGGSYAWRTAGSGGAGGDYYVKIPDPQGTILGNSFYTIRGYDIVFVIDSTGSMGDDIATVNKVAKSLIDKVSKPFLLKGETGKPTPNSRFAVVTYKDPGEVTTNLQFTESVMLQPTVKDQTKNVIGSIGASGGGDYPEGVNSGLGG